VWGVGLAATLTSGAFAPIIVAAVIGIVLITWGLRLSRLQK
jgi:K+ transporter